jgi:hypothetical protein
VNKKALIKHTSSQAEYWWLTPVILATWEAEMGRIMVQGQSR